MADISPPTAADWAWHDAREAQRKVKTLAERVTKLEAEAEVLKDRAENLEKAVNLMAEILEKVKITLEVLVRGPS